MGRGGKVARYGLWVDEAQRMTGPQRIGRESRSCLESLSKASS